MWKYAIIAVAIIGGLFIFGQEMYKAGKADIIADLAEAKVKVIKDGKEIDLTAESFNDNELCDAIGGC